VTDTPNQSPNWKWLSLTVAIGIALIVIAASVPWPKNSQWVLASTAALVNLGTASMFAALGVLLKPPLTRAARQFADELQAPLKSDINNLKNNMQTLTEQTEELLHARDSRIEQTLKMFDESPTFETVTNALEIANDLNAFAGGIATVQGGTDPDGGPLSLRVRFLWGTDTESTQPLLRVQAVCDEDQFQQARPTEGPDSGLVDHNDRLCSEVEWGKEERAAEVGARLVAEVQSNGPYLGSGTLDWAKTISELGHTLGRAVASRRAVAGVWRLTAPVFEFVGDDWAITEAGVENHANGVVFLPYEFPDWYPGGHADRREAWRPPSDPDIPAPDRRVFDRAVAYLPLRPLPNTPPGWAPLRRSP
jgi:hypothetical protein